MAAYAVRIGCSISRASALNGVRVSIQTLLDGSDANFLELSQTESVFHESQCAFAHKCSLNYRFDKVQRLKFVVYTVSHEEALLGKLGEAECLLSHLLARSLQFPLADGSTLKVDCIVPESYNHAICLKFVGQHIHVPPPPAAKGPAAYLPAAAAAPSHPLAAYFVLMLATEQRSILLHRSEVSSSKSPSWEACVVPLHLLMFYPNASLQLHVYNQNPNTNDSLIGSLVTSLGQLQRGAGHNTYMLVESDGRRGKASVELAELSQSSTVSMFDLLKDGWSTDVSVALDFTASNGNPLQPESLHYIHPHHNNPYMDCMLRVVPPLHSLSQTHISGLGFGCRLGTSPAINNCFFLTGDPRNPFCGDVNGLINFYRRARLEVTPFAPTEFADVIYHASNFAKASQNLRLKRFSVLVILTDGDLGSWLRTRDALVDAAVCPLLVLAIGLGRGRFDNLKALESPVLKHSSGRVASRQVFSFVPLSQLNSDDGLALLPAHIARWATLHNA